MGERVGSTDGALYGKQKILKNNSQESLQYLRKEPPKYPERTPMSIRTHTLHKKSP